MPYQEDEEKQDEPRIVDLDSIPELDESPEEYDYEANAFGVGVPPKPGTFAFKVSLNENQGVQIKKSKDKRDYFSIPLIFETDSENQEEVGYIFQTISTIIGRKKTSTAITILKAAGVGLPEGSISQKTQLELVKKWLASEPRFWLETDWEVTYKDEKGNYQRMFRSYKSIPDDPSNPGQKITSFVKKLKDGSSVDCGPRLVVKEYLGKTKEKGTKEQQVKSVVSSLPPKKSLDEDKTIEELEKELA